MAIDLSLFHISEKRSVASIAFNMVLVSTVKCSFIRLKLDQCLHLLQHVFILVKQTVVCRVTTYSSDAAPDFAFELFNSFSDSTFCCVVLLGSLFVGLDRVIKYLGEERDQVISCAS